MKIFPVNTKYTFELNKMLSYVTEVLAKEYPTTEITMPYIVLSLIECQNTHTHEIFLSITQNQNALDALKTSYYDLISSMSNGNPNVRKMYKDNGGVPPFNNEVKMVLETESEAEAAKGGASEIGTEHILLAILNKNYSHQDGFVLSRVGVNYDLIFKSCLENDVPLKSFVGAKGTFPKSQGKYISSFTTKLNKNEPAPNIIGRDKELSEIYKVLARKDKNNVILVGGGGVGKTAIVKYLSSLIDEGKVPQFLSSKEIVELESSKLIAGTNLRGMFEERIIGLFDEISSSKKYILFIDDIHNVLKSGAKDKEADISGVLGKALSDNKISVIATTTFKDYKNTIESSPSLSRNFQKIIIEPTNIELTEKILNANKKTYEEYHNVLFSSESVLAMARLAERYITDRNLPDSAFDIMDLCGASASVSQDGPLNTNATERIKKIELEKIAALDVGNFELVDSLNVEENVLNTEIAEQNRESRKTKKIITEKTVQDIVSEITNIPTSTLSHDEKERIAHIDEILKGKIIGQDEAVESVCKVIKRNKVGLGDKTKTLSNILCIGSTGVGKSLLAKQLAKEVFGDETALVRIDMSEFSEKSSVAKLIGSAPGYVGYENGGFLTETVKNKPHCVLLLDEIEKADKDVYNVFLQLFDDGRLTDGSGQMINFKNVIVLMTSNVGAQKASDLGGGIGFVTNEAENKKGIIEKQLKRKFSPEFLNRIDKIVHFNPLTEDNLKEIVKLELGKFRNRMKDIKYDIVYDDSVVTYIHAKAIEEKELGARPILRIIQDNIEDKVTDLMIENEYEQYYTFSASCNDNCITIR